MVLEEIIPKIKVVDKPKNANNKQIPVIAVVFLIINGVLGITQLASIKLEFSILGGLWSALTGVDLSPILNIVVMIISYFVIPIAFLLLAGKNKYAKVGLWGLIIWTVINALDLLKIGV